MAAGLVMLVINTQHGSAMERERTKSFDVAEAALDVAMQELGHNWPTSATTSTWFNATAFAARFPLSEFPEAADPQTFVKVQLTDNTDVTKSFDANGDGLVFVDAQARAGKRASRVHAEVQVIYNDVNAMRGLALWAGGNVRSDGGDPKVTVENFPPGDTNCSWAVVGQVDASVGASYMNLLQGGAAPSRQSVLSDEKIAELTTMAQNTGRYFTDTATPATTPAGYGGLCVIKAPAGEEVQLTGGQTINSEDQPGILLVLGGATIRFGGNTQYFGIVYSAGGITADRTHGTPIIHGMLITDGSLTGSGTPDVRYNDKCVRGLDHQFPMGSRLVPGFWRELKPTM